MMKALKILTFLLALGGSCLGQKQEEEAVRGAFNNYRSAILNDRGETAVRYVDSRTIKYYSDMLHLVRTADSVTTDSLSILDKLMVLTVRHRTTKEKIASFDGTSMLAYAIKEGMVGKNSVVNFTIGKVIIDADAATGQLVSKGQETPVDFHFYREAGQWKIDLTSIFGISAMAFEQMAKKSGESENDYLFMLLQVVTGKKPGGEVWYPAK